MLFKLKELSDLYADACVRDESGQLMFLSLYGRDTAIQQLLAAFTLKVTEGGLSAFHLQDPEGQAHVVYVGNAERLEKFTGTGLAQPNNRPPAETSRISAGTSRVPTKSTWRSGFRLIRPLCHAVGSPKCLAA